jgi:protocatechuate 3,4-dioxygenase beta subunit
MSVVLVMAHAGFAQQTIDHASISGRVLDQSGAVVPGADVTARHVDTNVVSTTTTDRDGQFRFAYLRVGPYGVLVHRSGFARCCRRSR